MISLTCGLKKILKNKVNQTPRKRSDSWLLEELQVAFKRYTLSVIKIRDVMNNVITIVHSAIYLKVAMRRS